MKKMTLGTTGMQVPVIAVGCMRIGGMEPKERAAFLAGCLENGLNFFDHADIYGKGECERLFAAAQKEIGAKREDMILQSKCGIRPGRYDFSKDYILSSVDGILKRLETDYLDVLLLHRPDALAEPEEVAEAFEMLHQSGKVRHFGVSNHRPYQIALLQKYVKQPLCVNQMQFSIPFSTMVAAGVEANMLTEGAVDRDGGVLDYCRLHDITIQAWSPFQYGFFEGVFVGNNEKYPKLNDELNALAEQYGTTPTAIAAAWVLRHPAHIQLVAGTTSRAHMREIIRGSEITLTREEWYRLYLAAGHILP